MPQRPDIKEIYELAPLDQVMMTFETNLVADMQNITECDKLNIATLGNKVPQLHQHIIARTIDDAAWPEPFGARRIQALPYRRSQYHNKAR